MTSCHGLCNELLKGASGAARGSTSVKTLSRMPTAFAEAVCRKHPELRAHDEGQSSYASGATARSFSAKSSPLMGTSLPHSHEGTAADPAAAVGVGAGADAAAAVGLQGQLGAKPPKG